MCEVLSIHGSSKLKIKFGGYQSCGWSGVTLQDGRPGSERFHEFE